MNQEERRRYLIQAMLDERTEEDKPAIPDDTYEQEVMLRSLFNVREVGLPSDEFLEIQDAYLKEHLFDAGIIDFNDIATVRPHIRLWNGDITLLECDAIVDPASRDLTGCWTPCHSCVDNSIHTFAGVQLRSFCSDITKSKDVPTGEARITPAFNLPAKNVIHTVIPRVSGSFNDRVRKALVTCYTNCYKTAKENGVKTLAFPSLAISRSTRDNQTIVRTAIQTIRNLQRESNPVEVCFAMFSDAEYKLYQSMLR